METLRGRWQGYAWALATVASCTVAGLAMRSRFDLVNIAMVYLLAVVIIALRHSGAAAIFTALLSVATLDVLFVPPHGAFNVEDAQYLLTFAIMVTVALVISGLTHRNRAEAEAHARLAIEAETERVRSALLASISHDLRTPLAVMVGASSTLAERGERMDAQQRQALAHDVFTRCREMSERVSKLLEMTRLDTGAIEPHRDWTSIAEIAASALRMLEPVLAGHVVRVDVAPDLPLVRVDAALAEQAIANLLENAAKHTPAGTAIRLRAEAGVREVLVCVEDSGPGIDDGDMERVFAKFQHGRVAGSSGMGLGLAICRAIVALHGGRAWAERLRGGGMAFRFSLPMEQAPAVPAEAEA